MGKKVTKKKNVKEEPLPEKPAVVVNDIEEIPKPPKITRTKNIIIPEKYK